MENEDKIGVMMRGLKIAKGKWILVIAYNGVSMRKTLERIEELVEEGHDQMILIWEDFNA